MRGYLCSTLQPAYHVVFTLNRAIRGQYGPFHGRALEDALDLTADAADAESLPTFGAAPAWHTGHTPSVTPKGRGLNWERFKHMQLGGGEAGLGAMVWINDQLSHLAGWLGNAQQPK